jgi:IMP cyclohydrolase
MPELQLDRDYPEVYQNIDRLRANAYPGRIAIMGMTSKYYGSLAVQAYAIMGRSAGSRSRIFVDEGAGSVRTTAPGKSAEEMAATDNAELIYYQAAKAGEGVFVISNGAQTSPVYESIMSGKGLEEAIKEAPIIGGVDLSKYEPDEPNFTPRITGVIDFRKEAPTPFGLSIVRKTTETDEPVYTTYEGSDIRDMPAGHGMVLHTYAGDGNPLPSFNREPYMIHLDEDAPSTALKIWRLLNKENRVALMTRTINVKTQEIEETCIVNAPPAK